MKESKIVQGEFGEAFITDGAMCLRLTSNSHTLSSGDLIDLSFISNGIDHREFNVVLGFQEGTERSVLIIQDPIILDEAQSVGENTEAPKISGQWFSLDPRELSVRNCHRLLINHNMPRNKGYYNMLFHIQRNRAAKRAKVLPTCDERYLLEVLKLPKEQIDTANLNDVESLNDLVGNLRSSYVNYDFKVVRFDDNYIISLANEGESCYFEFLCLYIFDLRIPDIDDVLNYHLQKFDDHVMFCDRLHDYFAEFCDKREVTDNKMQKVAKWIEGAKMKNISSKSNHTVEKKSKEPGHQLRFSDIFVTSDWKKYISSLQNTNPPLLTEEWQFIGIPSLHKGVVCSWIKYLQGKGKISQKFKRSELAGVLNLELKNFNMGKDGKTFDNVSQEYKRQFEEQLLKLTL